MMGSGSALFWSKPSRVHPVKLRDGPQQASPLVVEAPRHSTLPAGKGQTTSTNGPDYLDAACSVSRYQMPGHSFSSKSQ